MLLHIALLQNLGDKRKKREEKKLVCGGKIVSLTGTSSEQVRRDKRS